MRRLVRSCQIALAGLLAAAPPAGAQSLIRVDRRAHIARADLDYATPAARPEEGMPIGNGRMGSLIWTTPSALKLQINRVDVHAMDSTTFSFPRADSDYGYGCGFVDITVAGAGADVFSGSGFHQHLSLYDGLMTARGDGLVARAFAWPGGDVMAIEVDDRRAQPDAITVDLRMLRYQGQYAPGRTAELARNHSVVFRTAAHTATSTIGVEVGRIMLTQEYREGAFYDSSAVAIAAIGRPARARYLNQTTVQLAASPGRGRFTILIASAASDKPSAGAAAIAIEALKKAEGRTFESLLQETAGWWADFWSKSGVYLHSASGQADFIEANYDYFLYLMGSSSRGAFPPRFGGMLWQTDGDMSRWGSQYWWANTIAYYANLTAANRPEIVDPVFRLYTGMHDAAALAARQQWGSQGIWIPETTFFNGPERLPDAIAAELQDLVLARKPFEQRSPGFDAFAENKNRHNSRWNYRADGTWEQGRYVFASKGTGIFGHTSHILGVAARVGALAWQRYQLTGDTDWFRAQGYPFIRGAVEFYRNFPNLQKDSSGVYHINHTNSGESAWDSRDASYEVSCMHMIFPLAIRASEVLGVDANLQPAWKEVQEHLVPAPARGRCGTGSEIADEPPTGSASSRAASSDDRPYGAFVYNGEGAIEPIGPEADLKRRFLGFTRLGSFIDPQGSGGPQVFRNRLRLREGPGAIDAEHIAGLATGLHTSMLNSHPESLTNEEAMSLFNGWPKDWDAAFVLLARGDFIISAAQKDGRVPLVEIRSRLGGPLLLENPWASGASVYRNGQRREDLSGRTLAIATTKDETVVLVPRGSTPDAVEFDAAETFHRRAARLRP
ncbi:MAG TPA: hypothetical protein VL225_01265 [Vicinamibacterales bacterium]|nr:hypothetical protein [Vicinamibacterales bacterium]